MEERVLICEKSKYKSYLMSGIIAFMSLLCIDERIPMMLSKERIREIVTDKLKQLEKQKFPSIALACEMEISKLLPNCNFEELRKLIVEYYIVEEFTPGFKVDIINYSYVTSEKVLKYLDEQLYINVLNCVYDLMIKAIKIHSMERLSKKIMVGEKTCEALYPGVEFDEAIEILAYDIQIWINYNLLNNFCSIEETDSGLYLKVEI